MALHFPRPLHTGLRPVAVVSGLQVLCLLVCCLVLFVCGCLCPVLFVFVFYFWVVVLKAIGCEPVVAEHARLIS